jgi:hypothetical protein
MAQPIVAQVEFGDTTQGAFTQLGPPTGAQRFCTAVTQALNATVLCNSLIPLYDGNILMAGIQFQVIPPVNVYRTTTIASVNNALVQNGFFTESASYVTNVALYYHPDALAIGLIFMQLGVMYLLILLIYVATKPQTTELDSPLLKKESPLTKKA